MAAAPWPETAKSWSAQSPSAMRPPLEMPTCPTAVGGLISHHRSPSRTTKLLHATEACNGFSCTEREWLPLTPHLLVPIAPPSQPALSHWLSVLSLRTAPPLSRNAPSAVSPWQCLTGLQQLPPSSAMVGCLWGHSWCPGGYYVSGFGMWLRATCILQEGTKVKLIWGIHSSATDAFAICKVEA